RPGRRAMRHLRELPREAWCAEDLLQVRADAGRLDRQPWHRRASAFPRLLEMVSRYAATDRHHDEEFRMNDRVIYRVTPLGGSRLWHVIRGQAGPLRGTKAAISQHRWK